MAESSSRRAKSFGARTRTVDLSSHYNWPRRVARDTWWKELAAHVRQFPSGLQRPWGIPFRMARPSGPRVVMLRKGTKAANVSAKGKASFICFLHTWRQIPKKIRPKTPREGLVVGEYELAYADGTRHVQPIRARFELIMVESPGAAWVAMPFQMPATIDPVAPPQGEHWGYIQHGVRVPNWRSPEQLWVYAMKNPHPERSIASVTLRGLQPSPLFVAGLTLYRGAGHPLQHLPRRSYRVKRKGSRPAKVTKAELDLGIVARMERTPGPRGKAWVGSSYAGVSRATAPERGAEDLIEAVGAEDATVSVALQGVKGTHKFSLGEAFHHGTSSAGKATLEVLGKRRQWMQVSVLDGPTGKPTPVRIHFSGSRGEYLAPYGHHSQVNVNWFEDYGADLLVGGRSYAYVPGQFTTDLPVGDVYVEICKGFEYTPVRRKVRIRPGQKELVLRVNRWKDLRAKGWVTADTHVHFLTPHTAWLEARAEGVNVVNLLASQWGRLFTNVGDYTGRVGVVEDDTIVYVGTENRNHMLGHMSMLGTKGLPVFPMCCGGPGEAWVGDPDFYAMVEWARENRRKGGVVVRPHFPACGHTEDPVPILSGVVDALEIRGLRAEDFGIQEWYRYLNCGYRVAVVGGTDKMRATMALGDLRTYAKLDPNRPFTYDSWARAVRAGRTFATNGPLIDMTVEGKTMGESITLPRGGGTLAVEAVAESAWPLGRIDLVCNGRVLASERASRGARRLRLREKIRVTGSGWIAARCRGYPRHPGAYMAAHTSPVYLKCGNARAFDGPAAEHMLALVEGGIEYLRTLSTAFDEKARKRMVGHYKEARHELRRRLEREGRRVFEHTHGEGGYHVHAEE